MICVEVEEHTMGCLGPNLSSMLCNWAIKQHGPWATGSVAWKYWRISRRGDLYTRKGAVCWLSRVTEKPVGLLAFQRKRKTSTYFSPTANRRGRIANSRQSACSGTTRDALIERASRLTLCPASSWRGRHTSLYFFEEFQGWLLGFSTVSPSAAAAVFSSWSAEMSVRADKFWARRSKFTVNTAASCTAS